MKISLAPALDKFIESKLKSGEYRDAGDVIRDSLRRWKEQEEAIRLAHESLEQDIQEGMDSEDIVPGKTFWSDLRKELHREHKNGV